MKYHALRLTSAALVAVCIAAPGSAGEIIRATGAGQIAPRAAPSSPPTTGQRFIRTPRGFKPLYEPLGCSGLGQGSDSFIGGGYGNWAGGLAAGIVAGDDNNACDQYTFVGAGTNDVIGGVDDDLSYNASIAGGISNGIRGSAAAFIGGGQYNIISNPRNGAYPNSNLSAIGAGFENTIEAPNSFIGSGNSNTILSGTYGSYTTPDSFIGAGDANFVAANYASIVSGLGNSLRADESAIVGGQANTITAPYAFIGSGLHNIASGAYGALAGGANNTVGGQYGTVAGGSTNKLIGPVSFIGGGSNNSVAGQWSSIVGGQGNNVGGSDSFVGGGLSNVASGQVGTIVGGQSNTLSGQWGVISGGYGNSNTGAYATVGGGLTNVAKGTYAAIDGGYNNIASGVQASIAGGYGNTASGRNAAVPGGAYNTASGVDSFAGGTAAKATYNGTFVWSDDSAASGVTSTAANQFMARAAGGFYLYSSANLKSGVKLAPGSGSWSTLSDRAAKTAIESVDDARILAKVASLPVSEWSYAAQGAGVRHLGPMAQDFRAAFGLGEDEKHISAVDEEGVALAAIKALQVQGAAKDRQIAELRDARRADDARLESLEQRLESVERNVRQPRP